jgi:hypothetical protein
LSKKIRILPQSDLKRKSVIVPNGDFGDMACGTC